MESEKNKQALADVQARHQDIMKLEESVRELRDLFIEMAVLVESQGTMVDRIEYNVGNAADYVEKVSLISSRQFVHYVSVIAVVPSGSSSVVQSM